MMEEHIQNNSELIIALLT